MNLIEKVDTLAAQVSKLMELFSGDAATTSPAVQQARQTTTVGQAETVQRRRRRTRKMPPSVGYWANGLDKRTVKTAIKTLPGGPDGNSAVTLIEVVNQPGITNRQLAEKLVASGRYGNVADAIKPVQSALYQMRVHDGEWNELQRDDPKSMKHALIVSRELGK